VATEAKTRTYIVPVPKVFTALQNSTGQAPIGNILNSTVELDPASSAPNRAWFFTIVGTPTDRFYDIQKYRVTATEVAVVLNQHASTSFTNANIISISRYTDASFYQIDTA